MTDPENIRWLETLIWPEQGHRREQLAAAVEVARADPPLLVAGDLNETIDEMINNAPPDATLTVLHSAVLAYLDQDARNVFASKMLRAQAHWISNEGPGVIAMPNLPASPDPSKALFVVAHNGEPVAYADAHGQALYWLG